MKVCPKCNTQCSDEAMFCTSCGTSFNENVNQQAQNPNVGGQPEQQGAPIPPAQQYSDPCDHTAEFSDAEIHDNKIFAICVYLFDFLGVIIALLVRIANRSSYLYFHIKQQLKITVAEALVAIISGVLCWTCIVPIAGGICLIILLVLKVICFVRTCSNRSAEVPILSKFGFMK